MSTVGPSATARKTNITAPWVMMVFLLYGDPQFEVDNEGSAILYIRCPISNVAKYNKYCPRTAVQVYCGIDRFT
jgi:hypothetical protein